MSEVFSMLSSVTPQHFCWDIAEVGQQETDLLCNCEEALLW